MAKYYIYTTDDSKKEWILDHVATSQKEVQEFLGIGPTTFKDNWKTNFEEKPSRWLTPGGSIKYQITSKPKEDDTKR